ATLSGSSWLCFFFSSRRRHTRSKRDWSSDVCSSDLLLLYHQMIGTGKPFQELAWRSRNRESRLKAIRNSLHSNRSTRHVRLFRRSEERRVGKACSSRWRREHRKK